MTNSLTIYYNDDRKIVGHDLGDLDIVQGIGMACAWAATVLGHHPERMAAAKIGLQISGGMGEIMKKVWEEKDKGRNT